MLSRGIGRFFKDGHVISRPNVAIAFSVATAMLMASSPTRVLAQVMPDNPLDIERTALTLEGALVDSSFVNIASKGAKCGAIQFRSSLQLPEVSVLSVKNMGMWMQYPYPTCTETCAETCRDYFGGLFRCKRSGNNCISCPVL